MVSKINLGQILSDPRAINLLMRHLGREFSMECLLSLIEFIQFQNYVYQHLVTRLNTNEMNVIDSNNDNINKVYHSINNDNVMMDEEKEKDVENLNSSNENVHHVEICLDVDLEKLSKHLVSKIFEIDFPSNVPFSSIVFDKIDQSLDDDFKKIFSQYLMTCTNGHDRDQLSWMIETKLRSYKLYKKYIALGSEYEINVSYRTRQELIDKMDNLDEYIKQDSIDESELILMFKQSFHEMIHLIHGSFSRFKTSIHFAKFLKVCSFLNQQSNQ